MTQFWALRLTWWTWQTWPSLWREETTYDNDATRYKVSSETAREQEGVAFRDFLKLILHVFCCCYLFFVCLAWNSQSSGGGGVLEPCWGQRTTCRNQPSPCTVWDQEIKLRPSNFIASDCTCWAISSMRYFLITGIRGGGRASFLPPSPSHFSLCFIFKWHLFIYLWMRQVGHSSCVETEGSLQELVFPFYCLGPRCWTQAIRLGGQCFTHWATQLHLFVCLFCGAQTGLELQILQPQFLNAGVTGMHHH